MERNWYVLRARPRREAQVAAVLAGKDIEAYLPLLKRPARGGRGPRVEPLFPGYLFVRLAIETEEWLIARSTAGVLHLLGSQGSPSPVPDELVQSIRQRVELEATRRAAPYHPGERVRITAGSFRDLDAVFDRSLSASGRVRVFIRMVGRLVPLDLSAELLRRVS